MRKSQPGECVQALKDAIKAAGLATNPTVLFSFRPRFTRAMVADRTIIFISPAASDVERMSRREVLEHVSLEIALIRAIPTADSNQIPDLVDLDSHSLDVMFDIQSQLIQAVAAVPNVISIEPATGPNNEKANDALWFTVYSVRFF